MHLSTALGTRLKAEKVLVAIFLLDRWKCLGNTLSGLEINHGLGLFYFIGAA